VPSNHLNGTRGKKGEKKNQSAALTGGEKHGVKDSGVNERNSGRRKLAPRPSMKKKMQGLETRCPEEKEEIGGGIGPVLSRKRGKNSNKKRKKKNNWVQKVLVEKKVEKAVWQKGNDGRPREPERGVEYPRTCREKKGRIARKKRTKKPEAFAKGLTEGGVQKKKNARDEKGPSSFPKKRRERGTGLFESRGSCERRRNGEKKVTQLLRVSLL